MPNSLQLFRFCLFIVFLLIWVAACEPLAPEVTQQVIVVTNTPSATPLVGNVVPASPTPAPTRTPTPTATAVIIPTGTVPPCDRTEGTFFESRYDSTIAGGPVPYNVYLPPCFFESGRRYPLLLLLHGSGYDYTQWDDLGIQQAMDTGLANGTFAPMVIVMPEGGDFQENNIFDVDASYEDMILDELIPDLERTYCIQGKGSGRAIGGISRGGFWAFSIAFRYPDDFAAVGGHSPFFVPDNAPATHNPLALAERAAGIEGLRIYLDNAQNDTGGPNVIVFSNALRTRSIVHNYVINPVGGHDNEYWSAHLNEYLSFYSQGWALNVEDLPSCQ